MILNNGYLTGITGVHTPRYKDNPGKYNYWGPGGPPKERNPGPVTKQNVHTNRPVITQIKNLGTEWGKYDQKYQFNVSELGVYESFKVVSNGVELQFASGDRLRVEYSIGNVEMGVYYKDGSVFVGMNAAAGIANVTYYNQIRDGSYYFAYNASVSVLSQRAYLKMNNGVVKFHVGTGYGGFGFGAGITHLD